VNSDFDRWIGIKRRLCDQDERAFAEIGRLITGFLRKWHVDEAVPDLRQEVLIALWKNANAGRPDDERAFPKFAMVVVRNKVSDWRKRQRRWQPVDPPDPTDDTMPAGVDPPDERTPPPDYLHDYWRCFRALAQREQGAVYRVDCEGLTYDEAAAATGLPLGTFKRVLKEARANLRQCLGLDASGG
jgi:RNA polymerase sigma-70 factor (ECF subfamily)